MPNVVLRVVYIEAEAGLRNSTDEVGGLFILSLHKLGRATGSNPTDEVGWIVHT
jgi:hypothetical protein